jgi:nitrogen fixation protein FixH
MTSGDSVDPPGFRVKGWHVAAGVTAFFVIVIGVDASFAVMAYRTHPGQVSVTPYEDGLLYNQRITQLKAQDQLGWRASAEARPGVLAVAYVDRAGLPLRDLKVSARLERPATEVGRLTQSLREIQPGHYEADLGPMTGAWDLTFEALAPDGARFVAERRLTWR